MKYKRKLGKSKRELGIETLKPPDQRINTGRVSKFRNK